jgi:hypothetical protein
MNIGRVIKSGRKITDFEITSSDLVYEQIKPDGIRIRVVLFENGLIMNVLTHYSDREVVEETGDLS